MERDELLKMLDLTGKEAAPSRDDGLSVTPTELTTPSGPASPTALRLDGWGLRRGEELLAESERLKGLGLPVAPTLLVVSERTDALGRAARNVPWLAVETPGHASVYQVMRHERVVFEKAALLSLQEALA